jgi:hypothetical protein
MSRSSADRPRSMVRTILFGFIAICLGALLPLLIAESAFRFLPVATGALALPVNAANPVFRFKPNSEFIWSIGWRFSTINRGHVNNDGFVNDQDYAPSDPQPLLAVIGDSYVEAMMVGYPETLQGRVQSCLGTAGRAYSFAASGAPLSQYLIWADYARSRYAAQAMAFVIVGNDFDESLSKYQTGPGFHHFTETSDGALTLELHDYSPTSLRKFMRQSALLRYLVFNLHLEKSLIAFWKKLFRSAQARDTPQYVGNTVAQVSEERIRDSQRAVEAFFEELPQRTALPPSQIVFLIDGVRPQLYRGEQALASVKDAYFPRMREFFMHEARIRGYSVIDLQPIFKARHQSNGDIFEFEQDAHWNANGHEQAALALMRSRVARELFSLDSRTDPDFGSDCRLPL